MDHLKEMDEFLERYLPRLNQKEIEKTKKVAGQGVENLDSTR